VAGCLVERYGRRFWSRFRKSITSSARMSWNGCWWLAQKNPPAHRRHACEPYLYHGIHAACALHPGLFRLFENCRGLRPPLHLLRNSANARRFSFPALRLGDSRSRKFGQAGSAGNHHCRQDTPVTAKDLGLRDGCPRCCARSARFRISSGCASLLLPEPSYGSADRRGGGNTQGGKVFRYSLQHASSNVLKLMKRGSNGQQFLAPAGKNPWPPFPAWRCGRRSSLAFRAKPTMISRPCWILSRRRSLTTWAFFLYSNEETSGSFALPNQVSASTARRRQKADHGLPAKDFAAQSAADGGKSLPVLVEGPRKKPTCCIRPAVSGRRPASTDASS